MTIIIKTSKSNQTSFSNTPWSFSCFGWACSSHRRYIAFVGMSTWIGVSDSCDVFLEAAVIFRSMYICLMQSIPILHVCVDGHRPWKKRAWILRNALDVSEAIILLHGWVVQRNVPPPHVFVFTRRRFHPLTYASLWRAPHTETSSHWIGFNPSFHVGSNSHTRE